MAIPLNLISGGLKVISALLKYADKRQMLSAGQAQAVAKGLTELRKQVAEIHTDQRRVLNDTAFRGELRDKYRADDDPLNRM